MVFENIWQDLKYINYTVSEPRKRADCDELNSVSGLAELPLFEKLLLLNGYVGVMATIL